MQSNDPSTVVRIFDAFLQEKNIKWLLTIGMLIVVGSSAMMVNSHWGQMAGGVKFAILIAYAYGFVFLGAKAESVFGLRKTSVFLLATSVILVPMTFFGWNLLRTTGQDLPVLLALLAVNAALAWWTAARVFGRFFQGRQTTFLVAYLALCISIVVAPFVAPMGLVGQGFMALLWAVACVGVMKAARRSFWLSEQGRQLKIAGFAPALILSAQFLAIYATYFLSHSQLAWLGFGCVLMMMPVWLSADALLRVMQQRTGGVVRPLPAPIVLPIVIGMLVSLAGVGLSLTSLGSPPPLAVTPTALLAALVFAKI
jgi:hypothetical protein